MPNDDGHDQSAAPATENCNASSENVAKVLHLPQKTIFDALQTRRRMARERRGAESSLVSMETQFYKQYMKDVL